MNPEHAQRPTSRLEPETAWTVLTEAPLGGLGLAREAGLVLAWDEANQVYLLDLDGGYRSVSRAPGKVVAGAVSDDGSRVALLGEGSHLWLLDADLNLVAERQSPPEPLALSVDPHGRFVLVSSRTCLNQFYNRHGRLAGRFESNQPLSFLAFVPDRPFLIGAAAYGMLAGYDLLDAGGKLEGDVAWVDRQISTVGRLTTAGDGSVVLASCFTHGVQRYDLNGQNEGSYHLGGTAVHAVPDFAGRMFAVATLEGEMSVLNSAGNVRWKTGLPRPAVGLEVDPLGRYLVYGHGTGEVVRLDLYPTGRPRPAAAAPVSPGAAVASRSAAKVRQPDWSTPVASTDEQAETGVVAVLDDPGRIAVLMSNLRLQLFQTDGQNLGYAPEILGVGRILRTSPGWIAAATDRQVVVYDARRNMAQRIDLSLVEVTHLAARPESFGLAVVQERDRVGRATVAGRWVWKRELKSPVEDLAVGPDGFLALTSDDGRLQVYDPAGLLAGEFNADPPEPLSLIEAVEGAPANVVWMTLARRAQVLRGHDRVGRVVWESPTPFEGWQFERSGRIAVISAPDGRALAYDGAGYLRAEGKASEGGAKDLFTANTEGAPRRVTRHGVHLICSDLEGRVRWRSVCADVVGPVAVGRHGVAALIGRSLAWFEGLD